jgi:ABC-type sugar transport system substrate-binding protein
MMEEGYLDATGVQDVYFEAEACVQAILDLLDGKAPRDLIPDPGFVIHQGNKAELKARMWGARVKP